MIKILAHKPLDKGALKGFCNVEIEKWRLQIFDISIFEKDGRRWIVFPSKKVEKEGEKARYFPYMRLADRSLDEAFQNAFFEALQEFKAKQPEVKIVEYETEDLPF